MQDVISGKGAVPMGQDGHGVVSGEGISRGQVGQLTFSNSHH